MELKTTIYCDILERSSAIMKQEPDQESNTFKEAKRIYLLTIFNCIKDKLTLNKDSDFSFVDTASEEKDFIALSIKDYEHTFEVAKTDLTDWFAAAEIEEILEREPEPVVEPEPEAEPEEVIPAEDETEPEPEPEDEKVDININLDNVQAVETFDVDETVIDYSKVVVEEEEPVQIEEAAPVQENTVPDIKDVVSQKLVFKDTTYPDDEKMLEKDKKSFYYDEYLITLDGKVTKAYVYPLTTAFSSQQLLAIDIFVVFQQDMQCRGFMSDKAIGKKSIKAAFDNMEFMITAKWKNGVFESKLIPSNNCNIEVKRKSVVPEHFTSTTHMIIQKDGDTLHLFPAGFMNNPKTGVVGTVLFSEKYDTLFMPTPLMKMSYSKEHDKTLTTYWQGNAEDPDFICDFD